MDKRLDKKGDKNKTKGGKKRKKERKRKKKEKKRENKKVIKVKRESGAWENELKREIYFVFVFLLFVSLLDLRKLDRRFSLEQKAKLVYATRATCGYQKLSVSSNSKR